MSQNVIVGAGHFIEIGERLVQEFAQHGPDFMAAFQRATQRITAAIPSTAQVVRTNEVANRSIHLVSDGNDNNWHQPERDRVYESWESRERNWDAFQERQWENTKEGLQALAEAYGYASFGDLQSAYESATKAGAKAAEIFIDDMKQLFSGRSQ